MLCCITESSCHVVIAVVIRDDGVVVFECELEKLLRIIALAFA